MTSRTVPGPPWYEDRSDDVIEGVWIPSARPLAPRSPEAGRLLQAEESGALLRAVVEIIGSTREVVFVSSFLFAERDIERALLAAAQRGVRVYLLVASEARLEKEARGDDAFGQKAVEDHKRLLDQLCGWVYVRSAEHFHAKFVVADPQTRPRGLLLTANLTREALTRNHELAVRLTEEEARALAALFTWAFWESAQHELLLAGKLTPVAPASRVASPPAAGPVVATSAMRTDLRAAVKGLIGSARHNLVVATFGLDDREMVDALGARAQAGVAVTLLVRHPRFTLFETLRGLARAGVTVLGVSEWLHAKAIVADGERALVMTANLQERGLDRGFEVGVHLTGADATALGTILGSWQAAACAQMRASTRLGDLQGRVQIANGKGYCDVVVEREGTVVDGVTKVDCCTHLARAARPAAAREPSGTRYHRVKHTWSIECRQPRGFAGI
jgi:cardiolipin synthase